MQGKRFIRTLRLKNLLSYGSKNEPIELQPLNVLIGSNASGKSNLIEAIALLQSTPKDLPALIREGGGISDWLWKGSKNIPIASIEATLDYPEGLSSSLRYRIRFTMVGQRLELIDEAVENEHPNNPHEDDVYFFYRYQDGSPVLNIRTTLEAQAGSSIGRSRRLLRREDLSLDQSVLSQRKDPDQYPEVTYLGNQFSSIRLYREWNLGRNTEPRRPRQTDEPNDFLKEDASNLALVLNNLQNQPKVKRLILENLRFFLDEVEDLTTIVEGGTIQIFLIEKSLDQSIPATRLSDGTLRYLCLLSILCHPVPPPLICIEEPELGLHPDVLPTIANLLIEASQRTQLIVTTHSDALISALPPEAVLVCERDEKGTHLSRLDPSHLKKWLETYALGDLWRMGEIGGKRW
jgi:predicted ATPase